MSTPRTGLTRMSRVYPFHTNPVFCRLVGDETVELGKRPAMEASFQVHCLVLLASSNLGGLSDTGEVFENDGTTWGATSNDAFGEHMVCIPVESLSLASNLLEMSLSRLCSFGLQLTCEAEIAPINLFPAAGAKKLSMRCNCRAVESEVYSNHICRRRNNWLRNINHDLQIELPFTVTQISSSNRIPLILCAKRWNGEGDADTSLRGRQAYCLGLPVEERGFFIVAHSALFRLRTTHGLEDGKRFSLLLSFSYLLWVCLLLLGFPCQCALDGLSCLDSCLNEQVRNQFWTEGLGVTIGSMMQLDAVLFLLLLAIGTHVIEGTSKLSQCLLQSGCLLRGRIQLYFDRSVHAKSLPYMASFCKHKKGEGVSSPA
jgi:hypothetical protein